MTLKQNIINKLKTVSDPELLINIVDLGLIYDVKIDKKGAVTIKMTLTSPGCPLSYVFDSMVSNAVKKVKGVKSVKVMLTFDPPWDPGKMSEEARLQLGWVDKKNF